MKIQALKNIGMRQTLTKRACVFDNIEGLSRYRQNMHLYELNLIHKICVSIVSLEGCDFFLPVNTFMKIQALKHGGIRQTLTKRT